MARNQQPSLVFVGKTGAYLSRVFCSFSLMACNSHTSSSSRNSRRSSNNNSIYNNSELSL